MTPEAIAKPTTPPSLPSLSDIEGVWDLVSLSSLAGDGATTQPLGDAPLGRLIYTAEGVMSAQLGATARVKVGASLSELLVFRRLPRKPWLVFAALRYLGAFCRLLIGGTQYLAYSGTFWLTDGIVYHRVEMSTFPDWEGTVLERAATIDDRGQLTLIARVGLETQRLVWRRR
jgi:hypothetical protein